MASSVDNLRLELAICRISSHSCDLNLDYVAIETGGGMSFFEELKRRNVFRVGIAYVVAAWLLVQMLEIAADAFDAPAWVLKIVMTLLALGLVPTLVFSWAFELTPEGLKRESEVQPENSVTAQTAKKLDIAVIALSLTAIGLFIVDWAWLDDDQPNAKLAPIETWEIRDNSIAVLPFANRSDQADTQYFVDGIHDDLLTQLARNGNLKVISRTSVLEYRDTNKNMRQIGQELRVAKLLEGAVQRVGDRVRINAQLIDAETDEHLWAESFDRELSPENIFDIQTEIARAIAQALAVTLTPRGDGQTGDRAPTLDQEAYDLYLQARAIPLDSSSADLWRAIELGKQAVELDSQFALAMGNIGRTYTELYWFTTQQPEHREAGRTWIRRALALAPDDPRLQLVWAEHLYHGYLDYDAALTVLDKAESGLPNAKEIYELRGWILRRSGDFEGAIEAISKAIQLDPLDVGTIAHHIWTYIAIGDVENAKNLADRVRAFAEASAVHLSMANLVDLYLLGDSSPLANFFQKTPDANLGLIDQLRVQVHFLERRYDDTLAILEMMSDPIDAQFSLWTHSYVRARILHAQGQIDAARSEAQLAVAELNQIAATMPDNARPVVARGLMHAILGHNDRARADNQLAIKLYPLELDAVEASDYVADGLRALALIADSEELAKEMDSYLALKFKVYYVDYLLMDPVFDRHRDHPAIQALQQKYTLRKKR